MELCRTRLLVVLTFLAGPALAILSVSANLHHPAALPCQRNCLGVIRWTEFNKPNVLAECDGISCRSQEGFNMSHAQYLKGNQTLSISAADYSKRTWYICQCQGKDICQVRLIIKPLIFSVQKRPGEDLLLDLSITDPAELIYKSRESNASSGDQICRVEKSVLWCNAEYHQRASLSHTVINLRELEPSDSGLYIIQDQMYSDVICMYTVTVQAVPVAPGEQQEGVVPLWVIIVVVMVVMVVVVAGVAYLLWKKHQLKVRGRSRSNRSISEIELKELLENLSHERRSGLRAGPVRQRSYSDSYSMPLIMNDMEEQHNGADGTGQECMDLNCTIVLEQLTRKMAEVDQFLSQHRRIAEGGGSSDGVAEGKEWRKLENKFIESWKEKRKELYDLIMQHIDQSKTYHCTIHPDGRNPTTNITNLAMFFTGNGTAPSLPSMHRRASMNVNSVT